MGVRRGVGSATLQTQVRSAPTHFHRDLCIFLEGPPLDPAEWAGRDPHLTVLVAGNDCETFWDKDQLTDSCYQFNFQSRYPGGRPGPAAEQQGAPDLLSIHGDRADLHQW